MKSLHLAALFLLSNLVACAHGRTITGTTIPANQTNQDILETVEDYRNKLVQKDIDGLLLLASERYFEDAGTPQAGDDYGFEGLRTILTSRLRRVQSIRFDIEYRGITVTGDQAEVEVLLNGAFELRGETGDLFRRVSDIHRFILEKSKTGGVSKWKFLSGM
jgi:hypothetical protein